MKITFQPEYSTYRNDDNEIVHHIEAKVSSEGRIPELDDDGDFDNDYVIFRGHGATDDEALDMLKKRVKNHFILAATHKLEQARFVQKHGSRISIEILDEEIPKFK